MLYLLWLPYTITCAIYTYAMIKHYGDYEHDFKPRCYHSPKIIFQIMTKGYNQKLVQKNIDIIHDTNKRVNYHNYDIHVVTDGSEQYMNAKTINVSSDYKCENAIHKSRALQFATEARRKTFETFDNLKNVWILHLDEESHVTDNVVMACINFIENNPDKLIAEGAINYPNSFFKSQFLIPSFLEAERSFSCYFCCVQMNNTPIWLHGSNMLIRGDLEDEIGWDRNSMAEDACFGYIVANKKGEIFGWHHGTLFEQPAFTIKDTIKQRKRWFHGSLQNLKYLSWKKKILQISFLTSWKLGFFANLIGFPAYMGYIYVPEYLRPLLLFNLTFWAFTYQWGTWLNIRHIPMSNTKRMMIQIYCLLITPVLGFFSTLPAVLAVISKPKTFEIVRKS